MRKSILLGAAGLLILSACQKGETDVRTAADEAEVVNLTATQFHATVADTKTYLEGEKSIYWHSSDWISVLKGAGNYAYSTDDYGAKADFAYAGGGDAPAGIVSTNTWALYPYKADAGLSGNVITTWLSQNQTAISGDFPSEQKPVIVARSDAQGNLAFKNASAVLKFTIADEKPADIWLKGNNGEKVAGTFEVTYDGSSLSAAASTQEMVYMTPDGGGSFVAGTYYMVVAPTTFSDGLTLEWTDPSWTEGKVPMKKSTAEFTFAPGKLYDLGTIAKSSDSTVPEATLLSAASASIGTPYTLRIQVRDNMKLGPKAGFLVTNSGWSSYYTGIWDHSSSTGTSGNYYEFDTDGSASWVFETTVNFSTPGTYVVGTALYDYAGNADWVNFNIAVTDPDATDQEAPAVTWDNEQPLSPGQDYTLLFTISDPSKLAAGQWGHITLYNSSWTRPSTHEIVAASCANIDTSNSGWGAGDENGWFKIASVQDFVTVAVKLNFAAAGTYYLQVYDVQDCAGNTLTTSWSATASNCGIALEVANAYAQTVVQKTGLADGYYDLHFTTSRALSGGVVYASAQSGGNPARMTSLQYGTGVEHVIRGVQVSGGSCTVTFTEAAGAAAWARTSDITYTPSSAYTFLQGGDISRLNLELDHGVTYKEGGATKDLVDIAVDNGWNLVRIRVFNDPGNTSYTPSKYMTAGYVNKADAVALTKKAHDKGLQVLLSFHYSDYWTDPLIQNVPHAWSTYNEAQLLQAVYDYTTEVLTAIKAQTTAPEFVSIGNETNSGMLFGGGTNGTGRNSAYLYKWDKFTAFFNRGAQAVRDEAPSARVLVHLSKVFDSSVTNVLSGMAANSADYDLIGLSYYPYWTEKTVSEFVTRADALASSYGKDILVMETGFNWNTVTAYDDPGQLVDNRPYEALYPASAENQRSYLQELCNGLKKSSHILGFLYWDPLTVQLQSWAGMDNDGPNHDNGTVTQNSALFDFSGNRLAAWDAFRYNN